MNLKNVKYLHKFRKLPYPKNEMLIVGSGTLAFIGIRENRDLDVWASKNVIDKVSKNKNFIEKISQIDESKLYESRDGTLEFSSSFTFATLDFKKSMKRSIIIYGIHFQSPEDVLAWKKKANRPKDKNDIIELEKYLKNNVVENYLSILQNLK